MKRPTITFWRRLVQVICFVLFVYGGWVAVVAFRGGEATESAIPKESLVWTEGVPAVVDAYPPSAVCRFTAGGKAVSGCIIALVSESLTLSSSARVVLPYVLVFILLSFLLGRWWCGWVCPLGALGDLLSAARRWLKKDFKHFSEGWRRSLRRTAYGLLGATLVISWLIRPERYKATWQCWFFLPFCQICPARLACPLVAGAAPTTWGAFGHPVQGFFTIASWAVLGLFATSFATARRLWCHVCPIGLVTSWFSRGSPLELHKEATRCNRCGVCSDACPMGLTHVRDEKEHTVLNSNECIVCLRCVDRCPRDDCLSLKFAGLPVVRSRLGPPSPPRPLPAREPEENDD